MTTRSYAILGTGAIGGFYGARLQQSGLDLHFLVRSDYDHVRAHGLVIDSVDGNFALPKVRAYADVTAMPRCDVAIVAFKTTQNHLLPQLLPAVLKDKGMVVMLQNGLGVEETVVPSVGADQVLGGLCFICANKLGPGHIRHLDYGKITLAPYLSTSDPTNLQAISQDFQNAGIPLQVVLDLQLARWQKLVWNVPFNGLSVVLNAMTHELMAHPQTYELIQQLMQEVAIAAATCSREISSDFIQQMLADTARMKPYATSMKLDFDAQRPLEIDAIVGNPLRVAQQAGVTLPYMTMLYQQLQFLDSFRSALGRDRRQQDKLTCKEES